MTRSVFLIAGLTLALAACEPAGEPGDTGRQSEPRNGEADPSAAWPHPQDIPDPEAVAPGLAGEEPIDIVRFLMVRGPSDPELSPDGETLVFDSRATGKPQLWRVDADGGWPTQMTFGRAVTFHAWLPDGSGLLYAADRSGNEREAYWWISADGTREREVLPYEGAFRVFGDFDDDGSRFVYASTKRNGTDFDIYVADTESSESRRVYEGKFGFFARAWQPGGSLVLVSETRGEDANDLHLLDVETGALETLFSPEVPARYGSFAWAPDGSGFYMVTNHEREFRAVGFYDLESGGLEIVAAPEGESVDDLALSGDGRYLIWTVNEGGYSRLEGRDLESGEAITAPDMPDGLYGLKFAEQAPVLALQVNGPKAPSHIRTWNLESGETVLAAEATMAGIARDALVVPQSVFFEARDGVRLHGLLYMPDADTVVGAKPPVVVDVHGGPTAQARPAFQAVTQYLVVQGIAVFDVNVRGSTGFGKSFARLDNQRKRPDAVRDLVDTLAFLESDGRVDASRSAVMGGSYGGYMVNAVVGEYPDAFDAGVSFVGVSDWVRALEEASPALKASDRLEYGDITDPEDRAFFRQISPINNVAKIRVPMLFAHGANDPRDPVTESDRMVAALRERSLPVTYLRFPDEGHGVRKLENRVVLYRRVADFLERHLKGEQPPG